jgi:hypothetical protein
MAWLLVRQVSSVSQYDDLTKTQREFLIMFVDTCRATGNELFFYGATDGPNGGYLRGIHRSAHIQGVPPSEAFYVGLAEHDYLHASRTTQAMHVAVTRKAYDFVDYSRRPRLARWLSDLRHDLGHDDTLRSKIIWALIAVVLANLINVGLRALGWL